MALRAFDGLTLLLKTALVVREAALVMMLMAAKSREPGRDNVRAMRRIAETRLALLRGSGRLADR